MCSSPICRSENDTLKTGTLFSMTFCCFYHLEIGYISCTSAMMTMGSFGNSKYCISVFLWRLMLVTLFLKNKTNSTPIHFLLRRYTGDRFKRRESSSRPLQNSGGQHRLFPHFFTLFNSVPHHLHSNATHQEHRCSDAVDSKENPSSW